MRPIYITYGGCEGPALFVITSKRTKFGNWKVELSPCDNAGTPVSDPIEWDVRSGLIDTLIYIWKLYKEYN
jgi:hypothetical protein